MSKRVVALRDGRNHKLILLVIGAALVVALLAGGLPAQVSFDAPMVDIRIRGAAAVGDFNGDLIADVAAAVDAVIEIRLHDGGDRFAAPSSFLPAGDTQWISTADLNSDSNLDLVAGVASPNRVMTFLGLGDGSFSLITTVGDLPVIGETSLVRDVDKDGRVDVVFFSSAGPDRVVLLRGDGGGGFEAAVTRAVPPASDLDMADYNGDGDPDIALAVEGDSWLWLDVEGEEKPFGVDWVALTERSTLLLPGDFNEDGLEDLVAPPSILFGEPAGGFKAAAALPFGRVGEALETGVVADVNVDGHLDIVGILRIRPDRFLVALGDGTGSFGSVLVREITEFDGLRDSFSVDHFDSDGNPDLLLASQEGIAIGFGNGDGTFGTIEVIAELDSVGNVASGDFDEDNHVDLAVAAWDAIRILRGDGMGGFTEIGRVTGRSVFGLQAADFDEDGHLDLLFGTPGSQFHIYLGDGHGGFAQAESLAVPGVVVGASIDDIDGDSYQDVALLFEGERQVLFGQGDGTIREVGALSVFGEPEDLAIVDVDANGTRDFVLVDADGESLTLIPNPGDGRQVMAGWGLSGDVISVESGDVNRDGILDLVVVEDSPDQLTPLIGDGFGGFDPMPGSTLSLGSRPSELAVGDLDADGYLDFVTLVLGGIDIVYGADRDSIPDENQQFLSIGTSERVQLVDFFGTGRLDLVMSEDRFVSVRNRTGRDWVTSIDLPKLDGRVPDEIAKADLDNDGHLDLVVSYHVRNPRRLATFLGDGSGMFVQAVVISPELSEGPLVAGDFNGDGYDDVALGRASAAQILLGDGAGGLIAGTQVPAGFQPVSIRAADVDRDGILDLLMATARVPQLGYDAEVIIALGAGDGTFPVSRSIPGNWWEPGHIAVGNFDKLADPNGTLDLLVSDGGNEAVWFLKGDGTGDFEQSLAYPLVGAAEVAVADFDRDGHLDVATRSTAGVDLRFNDGFATFGEPVALPTSGYPARAVRARDINGDGQKDILVGHGAATVFLGTGTRTFADAISFLSHPPFLASSVPEFSTTGDFDGDGILDIVSVGALCLNRSLTPPRCRYGGTNALGDGRVDVLTVNGSIGGVGREVAVDGAVSLEVTLDRAPEAAAGGSYYAAIWEGEPDEGTVSVVPSAIGFACFAPLRTAPNYVVPLHAANTIRPEDPRLEPSGDTATGVPGNALPAVVLDVPPGTFAPGTILTFQALVGDRKALGRKPVSVSNAVVAYVE